MALDRPLAGRIFSGQLIRDNPGIGRPDKVNIVFGRTIRQRGRFHTQVITNGTCRPCLYLFYKKTQVKITSRKDERSAPKPPSTSRATSASASASARCTTPDSNSWDRLEDATVARNYHSVALLMPDGAVWTAGSNKDGVPSHDGRDALDTRELRIEIYRPWYFDRQRPQLVFAPDRMTYGQAPAGEITIEVGHADAIFQVAVVRTASTTHAYSSDQRYVELSFSVSDARHLRVTPPPSGGVAPPGGYLIFVLDTAHVPSTGRFITIA
jgi:hypothetical protein